MSENRVEETIAALGMAPHPEGGHYCETYRHCQADGSRGAITAIYYLLAAGERSHWHRIDAVEIWHWYAGDPLTLWLSEDGLESEAITLGNRLSEGQRPQAVVPVGAWQSAASMGAWSLLGCTVAPAFDFAGFEMAPPDWQPRDKG